MIGVLVLVPAIERPATCPWNAPRGFSTTTVASRCGGGRRATATLGAATRRLRRAVAGAAARFSGEVTTTDGSGCDAEPDCCASEAVPPSMVAASVIDA